MYYWFMLALAVFAEVLSTIGMKYAATSSPIIGYLLMALMISFSFYAFSRAVVQIPLAVSYAIWEGLGLLLIGITGVVLFGEYLTSSEVFAIALMLVGLLLVTFDKGKKIKAAKKTTGQKTHSQPAPIQRTNLVQVKLRRTTPLKEMTV